MPLVIYIHIGTVAEILDLKGDDLFSFVIAYYDHNVERRRKSARDFQ